MILHQLAQRDCFPKLVTTIGAITFPENIGLIRVLHKGWDLLNNVQRTVIKALLQPDLLQVQHHVLIVVGPWI